MYNPVSRAKPSDPRTCPRQTTAFHADFETAIATITAALGGLLRRSNCRWVVFLHLLAERHRNKTKRIVLLSTTARNTVEMLFLAIRVDDRPQSLTLFCSRQMHGLKLCSSNQQMTPGPPGGCQMNRNLYGRAFL